MHSTKYIGKNIDLKEEELNTIAGVDIFSDTVLYLSESFRSQCIKAGYHIVSLYPIYYQGWEMDEWGAIGTKDGKKYNLTTNHGNLVVTYMPSFFEELKKLVKTKKSFVKLRK